MFGIPDAVRNNPARLEKFAPGSAAEFRSFQTFLHGEKPDVAIATIYRFAKAGVDRFWQRHGIASASAALGRIAAKESFTIAAAHVGRLGDDDIKGCCLSLWTVPERHLEAGSKRRTEPLDPRTAQMFLCRAAAPYCAFSSPKPSPPSSPDRPSTAESSGCGGRDRSSPACRDRRAAATGRGREHPFHVAAEGGWSCNRQSGFHLR